MSATNVEDIIKQVRSHLSARNYKFSLLWLIFKLTYKSFLLGSLCYFLNESTTWVNIILLNDITKSLQDSNELLEKKFDIIFKMFQMVGIMYLKTFLLSKNEYHSVITQSRIKTILQFLLYQKMIKTPELSTME